MSKVEGTILCGKCKCDITGPEDHNDDSIFRCPQCGQSDRLSDIMEEAQSYFADAAKKLLDDHMDSLFKSSRFVTVTKFDPPDREYRWIASQLPDL